VHSARWAQRLAGWGSALRALDADQYRRAFGARLAHWREFLEGTPVADATRWPASWLRPKGNLSRGSLLVLLLIALLPLLSMIARISAWPGALGSGFTGTLLPAIGHDLDQLFSLRNIAPVDRDYVIYVLFVPTAAVLITLARLTFGIRVIGFRAILIAVGFQQTGIVPSLVLILVVVLVVLGVRPFLVRTRLPYHARAAVILSISVVILLSALLVAPWVRSETIWSMAFFPVIVLGLLTEGIAKTIDRDSPLTALWRATMTIAIALALAGISQLPFLREITIEFPELVLTQIVMIVLISEFLDLRLLHDWDAKLSGMAPPRLFSPVSALRIAVVRNRYRNGIIGRLGVPSRGGYRRRSVRRVVECLNERGHSVEVVEGDMSLLSSLSGFMPPHLLTGQPGGLVFNLAHGIQGDLAAAHVPAMLEMSGLAYTGPTPLGHACTEDRVVMRTLLRQAGVATPDFRLINDAADDCRDLHYPVFVGPRIASARRRRIARNRQQLLDEIARLARREGRGCIVEPVIAGRRIEVAMLGNSPARCLPLVETLPGAAGRVCPAVLDAKLAAAARAAASAAFRACNCRDYALVEICITPGGLPVVLGVTTAGVLEQDAAFEVAAAAAGLAFAGLIDRIVDIARERYRPEPAAGSQAVVPVRDAGSGQNGGQLVAG
jgi:D-alanine-D-alanine ligase